MKRDDLIFDIIEKEHQRQLKGIGILSDQQICRRLSGQTLLWRLRGGGPERTDCNRPSETNLRRRMG